MRRIALIGVLALAACSHAESGIPSRADEIAIDEVRAPLHDRCEKLRAAADLYRSCQTERQNAVEYLRKLNTGDSICLENGFGEEPRAGCKARGAVMDADARGFLIEVRDPAFDSAWHKDQGRRIYFENGALVDIYLRERGYE